MDIRRNVERVLAEIGLRDAVIITKVDLDRVWGWPDPAHSLLVHMVLNDWARDARSAAEHHHGDGAISFRERGVQPAMQVCLHPQKESAPPYFIEIDMDYASPTNVSGVVVHTGEVLANAITRGKTDQAKIAAMLDKRLKESA